MKKCEKEDLKFWLDQIHAGNDVARQKVGIAIARFGKDAVPSLLLLLKNGLCAILRF